jgi:hypothetical protein
VNHSLVPALLVFDGTSFYQVFQVGTFEICLSNRERVVVFYIFHHVDPQHSYDTLK